MIGALFYLQFTVLRNATVRRLRRLRQPRYLIATLVGVAYFYFLFLRRLGGGGVARGAGPLPVDLGLSVGLLMMVLLMAGRIAYAWVFSAERAALAFTEAEVAFLFPAPVSRRVLVHFKLLKSQLGILFSALLLAGLFNRFSALGGNFLTHAVGWWILFSTLDLHGIAASFTRERLLDLGLNPGRRRALLGGLLLAAGAAAWWWGRRHLPTPTAAERANPIALIHYVQGLLAVPPLPWVLAPFRWVLGPFFAPGGAAFLRALGPALLILAAHYLWVIRSDVAFEEASLDLARRRAERSEARRGGRRSAQHPSRRRREPFVLRPHGPPAVAFLWRNLLSAGPWFYPRTWLLLAAAVLAAVAWLAANESRRPLLGAVMAGAPAVGAWVLIAGPLFMRRQARLLMERLDVIKTLPLRGWQVVLGELLAPIVLLTAVEWLVVAVLAVGATALAPEIGTPALLAGVGGVGVGLLVPPVAGLMVAIPLAATLCFPAWVPASSQRAAGLEALGQRLIFFGGYLVVLIAALLPAACAAAGPYFAVRWLSDWEAPALLAGIAAAAFVLVAEFAVVVWWLGGRYERFDLSHEMPQ